MTDGLLPDYLLDLDDLTGEEWSASEFRHEAHYGTLRRLRQDGWLFYDGEWWRRDEQRGYYRDRSDDVTRIAVHRFLAEETWGDDIDSAFGDDPVWVDNAFEQAKQALKARNAESLIFPPSTDPSVPAVVTLGLRGNRARLQVPVVGWAQKDWSVWWVPEIWVLEGARTAWCELGRVSLGHETDHSPRSDCHWCANWAGGKPEALTWHRTREEAMSAVVEGLNQ